jgi:crotonobetainyl-CoA:carnitine CoA-transferase CaiB-like acyl-CoA transferase
MTGTALLHGIRVLDLTNVLAGPFCTYQLALQGADVLKIEIPGAGDLARRLGADPQRSDAMMGASFLAQNAGKRSMTLDLRTEPGKEILARLIDDADVLVENFRPGVLARLGFGVAELREANPRLVYCAISGFGAEGPMATRPAYDQIVQGLAGMMDVTGQPDGEATRIGFPVCDTFGGLTAAFAIVAALHRRDVTGEGAYLDVSMLDAALGSLGWAASNWLIAGAAPERMGNDNFTASPSGAFPTADGLLNIAANQQQQFETLCEALDRPDLATDPRFADRVDRLTNRRELTVELIAAFATRTAAEWEELLNPLGVPAARVLSVPEAFALEQVAGRDLVTAIDSQGDRPAHVVGPGFLTDGERATPSTSPPRLGADTDDVLTGLGLSDTEIASLRTRGVI